MDKFAFLNPKELEIFKKLNTPKKIQDFLERIPINFEPDGDSCVSPRVMLKRNKAHCIEAAFFAAAVLWFHGHRPLLMDIQATDDDYDHVVALFRRDNHWGAISKTNHAALRYREPVYRGVRELAMSYFHEYFDDDGKKNMRAFSKPFNMARLGAGWITSDKDLWHIAEALDDWPHEKILTRNMLASLRRADQTELAAGDVVQFKK